jgi:hypothetical protein
MAILSSKQFDKERPVEKPAAPVVKAEKKKGEEQVKVRMLLKQVKNDEEANAAFTDEQGVAHNVTLKYGVYEIADGPGREKEVAMFKAAGFVILDTVEDEAPVAPEKPKKLPKKFTRTIRLQHPDYTPDNAITSDITVGKKKVHLDAGFVESDDPQVVVDLTGQGYLVMNPHDLEKEMTT